jgi:hypothetical protein
VESRSGCAACSDDLLLRNADRKGMATVTKNDQLDLDRSQEREGQANLRQAGRLSKIDRFRKQFAELITDEERDRRQQSAWDIGDSVALAETFIGLIVDRSTKFWDRRFGEKKKRGQDYDELVSNGKLTVLKWFSQPGFFDKFKKSCEAYNSANDKHDSVLVQLKKQVATAAYRAARDASKWICRGRCKKTATAGTWDDAADEVHDKPDLARPSIIDPRDDNEVIDERDELERMWRLAFESELDKQVANLWVRGANAKEIAGHLDLSTDQARRIITRIKKAAGGLSIRPSRYEGPIECDPSGFVYVPAAQIESYIRQRMAEIPRPLPPEKQPPLDIDLWFETLSKGHCISEDGVKIPWNYKRSDTDRFRWTFTEAGRLLDLLDSKNEMKVFGNLAFLWFKPIKTHRGDRWRLDDLLRRSVQRRSAA